MLTGLIKGETYKVSVVAHSAVGDSPPSFPATFRWASPPSRPLAPTAKVLKGGKVTVSWVPVDDDGGLPVTYTLVWSGRRYPAKTGQTSLTLSKVKKGTYRAAIMATNTEGAVTGDSVTVRVKR